MTNSELNNYFCDRIFVCPCCDQEKSLIETPLADIFKGEYYNYCFSKSMSDELNKETILGNYLTFLDWAAGVYKLRKDHIIYHAKLWACITCVSSELAKITGFSKQAPAFGGPILMYVRQTYNCKKCSVEYNFDVQEQKYWYEELKFTQDSRPIHCKACRLELRKIKKAQKSLMELLPKDPDFTIEELKRIIGYYMQIGSEKKQLEFEGRLKNKEKHTTKF